MWEEVVLPVPPVVQLTPFAGDYTSSSATGKTRKKCRKRTIARPRY
jgi:hypothetical protein